MTMRPGRARPAHAVGVGEGHPQPLGLGAPVGAHAGIAVGGAEAAGLDPQEAALSPRAQLKHNPQNRCVGTTTRWPGRSRLTSAPTSSMTPQGFVAEDQPGLGAGAAVVPYADAPTGLTAPSNPPRPVDPAGWWLRPGHSAGRPGGAAVGGRRRVTDQRGLGARRPLTSVAVWIGTLSVG